MSIWSWLDTDLRAAFLATLELSAVVLTSAFGLTFGLSLRDLLASVGPSISSSGDLCRFLSSLATVTAFFPSCWLLAFGVTTAGDARPNSGFLEPRFLVGVVPSSLGLVVLETGVCFPLDDLQEETLHSFCPKGTNSSIKSI